MAPTYDKTSQFLRDWAALTLAQRRQFLVAVAKMVYDLEHGRIFRDGLRIKGVQGHEGIYEMTWEMGDGRATFEYGTSPHPGDTHIIWRRIDGHAIFLNP